MDQAAFAAQYLVATTWRMSKGMLDAGCQMLDMGE